ncbi:UNVERIFIED_CONTAM: hypothetical protein PYX00_011661 [Menopon gallinae]|uniref:Uncharacterized protein n=1 Tax=Menopon gallinae TaxID=328185 RepID=A0AAW2H7Y8_9NEOP
MPAVQQKPDSADIGKYNCRKRILSFLLLAVVTCIAIYIAQTPRPMASTQRTCMLAASACLSHAVLPAGTGGKGDKRGHPEEKRWELDKELENKRRLLKQLSSDKEKKKMVENEKLERERMDQERMDRKKKEQEEKQWEMERKKKEMELEKLTKDLEKLSTEDKKKRMK